MNHFAVQGSCITAFSDLIGEGDEDAFLKPLVFGRAAVNRQPFAFGDFEEPFVERFNRSRGTAVDAEFAAGIDAVVVFIGKTPCAHETFKIGDIVVAEKIIALSARLFAFVALENTAPLRECGDQAGLPDAFIFFARDQHPRITWVHRKADHFFADFC